MVLVAVAVPQDSACRGRRCGPSPAGRASWPMAKQCTMRRGGVDLAQVAEGLSRRIEIEEAALRVDRVVLEHVEQGDWPSPSASRGDRGGRSRACRRHAVLDALRLCAEVYAAFRGRQTTRRACAPWPSCPWRRSPRAVRSRGPAFPEGIAAELAARDGHAVGQPGEGRRCRHRP